MHVPIDLSAGASRLTIDPGDAGRLTSFIAGGAERLVTAPPSGTPPEEVPFLWGTYLMAPWAGRLAGNRLEWDGQTYDFPVNFRTWAIHGLVLHAPWSVEGADESSASLSCSLDDTPWPFGGTVRQRMVLGERSLELSAEATAGERSMPVSMGWHPWFRRPDRGDVSILATSDNVLELDGDSVPTGKETPVEGDKDLRSGPPIGARRLDDVYTQASAPAFARWPDLELRIDWSRPIETLVIHTPEGGFCVEPQTGWPNAPALEGAGIRGTGLIVLEAGATAGVSTTWTW